MEAVIGIVIVAFGILELILFFKLWRMTNEVSVIKNFLIKDSLEWAKNVTEAEKIEAMPFVSKLSSEQVIVKVASTKEIEVWSAKDWESEQNNPVYKLIYKN